MRKKTRVGTVSMHLVYALVALAQRHGHRDPLGFVQKYFGLSKTEVEDPETRLPIRRVVELLNWAVEVTGIRDLGLQGVHLVDVEHMGIGEFLARSRSTMREAIDSSARYARLLSDGVQHSLEIDGKVARWRVELDPTLKAHPAAYEFMVALGVLRARRMTGLPDIAPFEVHFMHSRPSDLTHHQQIFACPIRFNMPVTQVVISARFLEQRVTSAEPVLSRLLERQAQVMLDRLPPASDLATQVRALLGAESQLRNASAVQIARQLGMGVRSFKRLLSEQNVSYQGLFDEARKQAALRDLEASERAISEIAFRLGFSRPQTFYRAFRRWTGTTPTRYRNLKLLERSCC